MLAFAGQDQISRTLAELVREDPSAAAAVMRAMPPAEAAAALSLIVASANSGNGLVVLSDRELADMLKGAPPDVLKQIQPATALGTVGPATYYPPRHPTHFEPSLLELHDIL